MSNETLTLIKEIQEKLQISAELVKAAEKLTVNDICQAY